MFVNFPLTTALHAKLSASQPVADHEMHAAGFTPPVLNAAKKLGLNWLSLIQLAIQYGPQLLQILLDMLNHIQPPAKP